MATREDAPDDARGCRGCWTGGRQPPTVASHRRPGIIAGGRGCRSTATCSRRTSAELLSTAPPHYGNGDDMADPPAGLRALATLLRLCKRRDSARPGISAWCRSRRGRSTRRCALSTGSTFSRQPDDSDPDGAVDIHGISDERVRDEETWARGRCRRLNQWIGRVRRWAPRRRRR